MFSLECYGSLIRTMSSTCSKLIEICKKHEREEFIPFLEVFLKYPTTGAEISTETVVDFSIRLSSFRHIMLALASESRTMLRSDISMMILMATLEGENVLEQKMFKAVEFSKDFFECLRTSLSEFGEKGNPLQELFSNISEN